MPQKLWREPLDAKKISSPKVEVHIIRDLCKGCDLCIEFCPKKILEKSDRFNKRGVFPPKIVDESGCKACGFCMAICPDFAIFIVDKASEKYEKKQ